MADYISTLNGAQMDAALIDMAQHNSEAYAVGERDGVPVNSSDPTYHNNSKYYAEQAENIMVNAGISDPNNDGNLVVDLPAGDVITIRADATQNLSDSETAQARANIAASGSNPNLLDNPWFVPGSVVNQRGSANYTSTGYTVDRWKNTNGVALTSIALGTNGLTFTKASGGYAFFSQILGHPIDEEETYTLSVLSTDGVHSATGVFVSGTSSETYVTINGMEIGFGLYGKGSSPYVSLYFKTTASGTVTIKAIKLELGSASTLLGDSPSNYEVELEKCKYYFERILCGASHTLSIGFADAGDTTHLYLPLKCSPKRATPTASYSGTIKYGRGNMSSSPSISAISIDQFDLLSGYATLQLTGTSLTVGNAYRILLAVDAYIDLSAEL